MTHSAWARSSLERRQSRDRLVEKTRIATAAVELLLRPKTLGRQLNDVFCNDHFLYKNYRETYYIKYVRNFVGTQLVSA